MEKKHDAFEWAGMLSGVMSVLIAVIALCYAIDAGIEQGVVIGKQIDQLDLISKNTKATNVIIDSNLSKTNVQLSTLDSINMSVQNQIQYIDSQLLTMHALTRSLNRMVTGMNKMPYTTLFVVLPNLEFRQFAMFNSDSADLQFSLFNSGSTLSTIENMIVYFPKGANMSVTPDVGCVIDTVVNETLSSLANYHAAYIYKTSGPIVVKQSNRWPIFTLHIKKISFPPKNTLDIDIFKRVFPLRSGLLNIGYTINDNERGYYGVRYLYIGHGYLMREMLIMADSIVDGQNKETVAKNYDKQATIPEN